MAPCIVLRQLYELIQNGEIEYDAALPPDLLDLLRKVSCHPPTNTVTPSDEYISNTLIGYRRTPLSLPASSTSSLPPRLLHLLRNVPLQHILVDCLVIEYVLYRAYSV